jgi:hypothetical protein
MRCDHVGMAPLTPEEDGELRRLAWFSMAGAVSEETARRIAELRARDRRYDIRDPRPDPIGVPWEGFNPMQLGIRGRCG